MNMRWLMLDYVDPELKLTKQQRRRVRERAMNLSFLHNTEPRQRKWRWWHIFAALLPSLAFLPLFVWMAMGQPTGYWIVLMFLGCTVLPWLGAAYVARWTWRPFVTRALRENGYNVCVRCGYWLRGLNETVDRCPECGETRVDLPMESQQEASA